MDLNRSGIYQIRNVVNNRIYIGSSDNCKRRKREHFRLLRVNNHYNRFLQRDFNKCGEPAFRFFIIEYCEIEELIQYEQKWLDVLFDNKKNCYNILAAAGSTLGFKHSAETKQKMKQTPNAGRFISEKIKGANHPMYGKKHSAAAKRKISEAHKGKYTGKNHPMYGKTHSLESKQKMSFSKKGKYIGAKNPRYNNIVYHFMHKDGREMHCTQFELRKKYDLNHGHLSAVASGNRQSHKGWTVIKT